MGQAFSRIHVVQTGAGTLPISYQWEGVLSLEVKRPWNEAPNSTEAKNMRISTLTSPYAFTWWLLIKYGQEKLFFFT
jgi:hypothetical protein